jgi:hypothetical protein
MHMPEQVLQTGENEQASMKAVMALALVAGMTHFNVNLTAHLLLAWLMS